jgi:CBS domain containing-hemolysin-like protein
MDITQLRPIDLSLAQSKPPLIAVSPTVSIQTALTVMNKHHFTSLPIFSHDSTKVISIVNLFDILLYLVGDLSTVQVDKFPLDHPVENVLGLDADRESYRIHKTNPNDKLLDVSGTKKRDVATLLFTVFNKHSMIRHCASLLAVATDL